MSEVKTAHNSNLIRKMDAFTPENIQATKLPDHLKSALIALMDLRDDFFAIRRDRVWVQIINTILLTGYKNHRSEWIKLFARNPKEYEPVKGVYDSLTTERARPAIDFIAQPCKGCNTQELKVYKETGKLPERVVKQNGKTKSIPDIVDARSEDDVMAFFGHGKVNDTELLTSLRAYAEAIGIKIHQNVRKPEKIAAYILAEMEKERMAV